MLAPLGAGAIAALLERTVASVRAKAAELHVSLRPNRILDTPTTLRLSGPVRARLDAALCPACGVRVATIQASGFCAACHLTSVLAAKEEELAAEIVSRRLITLRQRRHRLRVCEECGGDYYPRATSAETCCPACREG